MERRFNGGNLEEHQDSNKTKNNLQGNSLKREVETRKYTTRKDIVGTPEIMKCTRRSSPFKFI